VNDSQLEVRVRADSAEKNEECCFDGRNDLGVVLDPFGLSL